jgi:hypothetical protein
MQHFADFGYIKQANKQLKRMYETKIDPISARNLGELSAEKYPPDKQYFDSMLTRGRYTRKQKNDTTDPLTRPIVTEVRTGQKSPEQLGKDWSDIRKNTDSAINSTHLGFRKDPYKGYGGMMEEAIPIDELYNTKKVRNTTSRLSGLVP